MLFRSQDAGASLTPWFPIDKQVSERLRVKGNSATDSRTRAQELFDLVGLDSRSAQSLPRQLSGGQRQRVAMGRAIVRNPQVFLMDEPLSNLDAKLRVQTRTQIASLQKRLGVTTVYVTHDQTEAMTMGDRVAVMKDGFLQQVDTPQNLYKNPANSFVAGFIGSPAMNLIDLPLTADGALLAGARLLRYRHASVEDAARCLMPDSAQGQCLVTDGVFSMDGDCADLPRLHGLLDPGGRQRDIGPAGEAVFQVPNGLAMADENELVHTQHLKGQPVIL